MAGEDEPRDWHAGPTQDGWRGTKPLIRGPRASSRWLARHEAADPGPTCQLKMAGAPAGERRKYKRAQEIQNSTGASALVTALSATPA
jgi:hypothetical protein